MNFINLNLVMVMFFCGLMVFFMNYKFLIVNLLSLEFLMLSMFFLFYIYLINFNNELYFSMLFMTFMVCEGVLGLSLLILMIRNYGNNLINSLNLFKC